MKSRTGTLLNRTWAMGSVLAVLCLVLASLPFETGDSYCGSVFYDTNTAEPCGSGGNLRRAVVVVCGVVLLAALGRRALNVDASRRRRRLAAAVLLAISALSILVFLNRLLQPTRNAWCGSIVNRHRTYDTNIEMNCENLLEPMLRTAIGAGVVAVASLVVGLKTWSHATSRVDEVAR